MGIKLLHFWFYLSYSKPRLRLENCDSQTAEGAK